MTTNLSGRPRGATAPRGGYTMAVEGSTAEVMLYGEIGGWWDGVDAATFVQALAGLDVDTIELRVNSPGGLVYDGVSIMNAIRRHPAKVIATVDGLAASAASFIIQAADEIVMGSGSELMIHDASSGIWGDATRLRKEADSLDRISQTVAAMYAERAGGTAEEWRTAMLAETWYSAEEAVAAGLADRVEQISNKEIPEVGDSEATNFVHAGRSSAPPPFIPTGRAQSARPRTALEALAAFAAPEPPAEPVESTTPTRKEVALMGDITSGLRDRLGIPADSVLTDEQLLAAVDEALNEQADPTNQTTSIPAGAVIVEEATLNELRANAAAGVAARNQQLADARTTLVDAAVRDGRIAPARRDHWEKALAADPGMADSLAALAPGLVPLEASGVTGGVDAAPDQDIYNSAWGAEKVEG